MTFAEGFLHLAAQAVDLLFLGLGQPLQHFVVLFGLLIALQVGLRSVDHVFRELQHFHHFDAVALLHFSLLHLVFEDELPLVNPTAGEHVLDPRDFLCHPGHFVEVGGEEALRTDVRVQVLANGPGHPEALASARAPPQLVDQHQRTPRGCLQQARTLQHLAHEGGDALDLQVRSPHPRDNRIDNGGAELSSRHEGPDVGQVGAHSDGPDVRRLPPHVRPSQDHRARPRKVAVVGDAVLQAGVAHLQAHDSRGAESGAGPLLVGSEDEVGEGGEDVELGELGGELFHDGVVAGDEFEHLFEEELLLGLVLFFDGPELFAEPGEGVGDEGDFGLLGSEELVAGGLLDLADGQLLVGLQDVAVRVGGHLLDFQGQVLGHLEDLLVDLVLQLLLAPHNGLQRSLRLGPHEELAVPAPAHVDPLLDHLADLADDAHVALQLLLELLQSRLARHPLLQAAHQLLQRLHCPVNLDQVRHLAPHPLPRGHPVEHEVQAVQVRQLLQLVLDEGLEGRVGREELDPVEATLDVLGLLERLLHPPFEAAGAEGRFALVEELEEGAAARQHFAFHFLAEHLEGVGGGRVQQHAGVELHQFEFELVFVPCLSLQVDYFQQAFQGCPAPGLFQFFVVDVEGHLQQVGQGALQLVPPGLLLQHMGLDLRRLVQDLLLLVLEFGQHHVHHELGFFFFGVELEEQHVEVGVVFVVREGAEGEGAGGVVVGCEGEHPFHSGQLYGDQQDNLLGFFLFLFDHQQQSWRQGVCDKWVWV